MIVLKNVYKSFRRRKVLEDVSFQIQPGEFVCITGPSGAGKTTLVHILAGAEEVSSGGIEVDGVDLRAVPPMALRLFRRRVGVVFQDYRLLPHLTVSENIAFPLEVCGESDRKIRKRVPELLKQLKLTKVADAYPEELSGGEQARTAIARAIVHAPMILLADEPTGNLDPEQSHAILKIFKKIHKDGTTVVLATHDTALVDAARSRVIELQDGRIMRDSRGGYKVQQKSAPHQILKKKATPAKKESPTQKRVSSGKKRKVRITSIGS